VQERSQAQVTQAAATPARHVAPPRNHEVVFTLQQHRLRQRTGCVQHRRIPVAAAQGGLQGGATGRRGVQDHSCAQHPQMPAVLQEVQVQLYIREQCLPWVAAPVQGPRSPGGATRGGQVGVHTHNSSNNSNSMVRMCTHKCNTHKTLVWRPCLVVQQQVVIRRVAEHPLPPPGGLAGAQTLGQCWPLWMSTG
jgi:hypothetical protein